MSDRLTAARDALARKVYDFADWQGYGQEAFERDLDDLIARAVDEAHGRVAALEAALLKYGEHDPHCRINEYIGACNCGYGAAIQPIVDRGIAAMRDRTLAAPAPTPSETARCVDGYPVCGLTRDEHALMEDPALGPTHPFTPGDRDE